MGGLKCLTLKGSISEENSLHAGHNLSQNNKIENTDTHCTKVPALYACRLPGNERLVRRPQAYRRLDMCLKFDSGAPSRPSRQPHLLLATPPPGAKAPLLQQGSPSLANNTFVIHRWTWRSLIKVLPEAGISAPLRKRLGNWQSVEALAWAATCFHGCSTGHPGAHPVWSS